MRGTSPSAAVGSSSPSPSRVGTASIAGALAFPAEGIPPMSVFAIPTTGSTGEFFLVRSVRGQASYMLKGSPAGTYYLFAVPTEGFGDPPQHFVGGYTKGVLCGNNAGCEDHSPVPVTVSEGQAVTGIGVTDFYAGANAFPLVPSAAPFATPMPTPARSYPDVMGAARYAGWTGTGATALQDLHPGTRAAYVVARAGSNNDLTTCGIYVYQDSAGWHPLDSSCGSYPAPGKTLNASFRGSGCIDVRANPGSSGKIIECLPVDTRVTVDGGPVFATDSSASINDSFNELWWHLTGHGWMAHRFLVLP
jgi:hypothetical protein